MENFDSQILELIRGFKRFKLLFHNICAEDLTTPGEFHLLLYIKHKNDDNLHVNSASLVSELKMTKPLISRFIRNLEEKSLLTKNIDESDKRYYNLYVTPKGRTLLKENCSATLKKFRDLTLYLGEDDTLKLFEIFRKIELYFETERKDDY